jgi:hypothetical protein
MAERESRTELNDWGKAEYRRSDLGKIVRGKYAKSFAKPECVYCGSTENLTKDHIPPKNLFAKPRPTNLITVPSCESCNASFQMDDEYLQMVLHARLETGGHPELLKLKPTLAKSLRRRESVGFHRRIRNSMFKAELISKEGIYLGAAPAMSVQGKRLERSGTRIIKGLFFAEKGRRLPDSHEAFAFADPLRGKDDPEALLRVLTFLLQQPANIIGNNVFSYRYHFDEEDPNRSAWLMVFYEAMLFLGLTLPFEEEQLP